MLNEHWDQGVTKQEDFQIAVANKGVKGNALKRWVEIVLKEGASADLAYYNKRGARNQVYTGAVTARHTWDIEPFGNTLS